MNHLKTQHKYSHEKEAQLTKLKKNVLVKKNTKYYAKTGAVMAALLL